MSVTSVRLSPEVEEKLADVAERARRMKSWSENASTRRRMGTYAPPANVPR